MWGVFDLTASAWLRKCNWILSSWSFLVQNLGGLCSSYNKLWHLRFGLPYSFKVRWLPHSSLLTQECYHSSCVQDKSERWIVQTDGLKQSQVITMIVLDVQCICILWAAILSCYFDVLYHLYLQLTEVQLGIFKERWLFFVFLFFSSWHMQKQPPVMGEQAQLLKKVCFLVLRHVRAPEEELTYTECSYYWVTYCLLLG